ncbi:MAG TPA: aminotransferase class I/II-fold pyridoxal phosphate-dependent enzyme [archaeon]|nr:aminotransferase class I/II-fold pyridoxal phosphate-dependent enzyme [archaeon]
MNGLSKKAIQLNENSSIIRFMFSKANELKKKSKDVSDLSLGNPVSEPPKEFIKGIEKALKEKGIHRYMDSQGFLSARKKISQWINKKNWFKCTPENILMTAGAATGIVSALFSLIEKNEEVIVFKPYFVDYLNFIKVVEGKAKLVDLNEDFSIDFNKLEKAFSKKIKAVIFNSPNNPTGKIYSKKELQELSLFLNKMQKKFRKNFFVLSDELYMDINFSNKKVHSIAEFYSNTAVIYSWSKIYSIPGERIGFVAVPRNFSIQKFIQGIVSIQRSLGVINANALMQKAIEYSLNAKTGKTINLYKKFRNKLIKALQKAGFEVFIPEGTFYLTAKIPKKFKSEQQFIKKALKQKLVVAPGSFFGLKNWIRIAFCLNEKQINSAVKKIENL